MFYLQRLQYFSDCCHATAHEMENRSHSNRFQHVLSWQRRLQRHKECFLRRLLRDRLGTVAIEVINSDKSKRRSLRRALRADVYWETGPRSVQAVAQDTMY